MSKPKIIIETEDDLKAVFSFLNKMKKQALLIVQDKFMNEFKSHPSFNMMNSPDINFIRYDSLNESFLYMRTHKLKTGTVILKYSIPIKTVFRGLK